MIWCSSVADFLVNERAIAEIKVTTERSLSVSYAEFSVDNAFTIPWALCSVSWYSCSGSD